MSARRPRVLVTDGEQRAALAACRGLAQAGYAVEAAGSRRTAVAHWSRTVTKRILLPEPRDEPEEYVGALGHAAQVGGYNVVLAGSEASLLPISEQRELLEPFVTLGLPPHERVIRALDKHILLEEAHSVGLDPPPSRICGSAAEAHTAAEKFGFPVVVKPARSFLRVGRHLRQETARVVGDEVSLDQAVHAVGTPCTIQVFAAGTKVVSCSGVRAGGGHLLVGGVCRYVRTWPPVLGNASMAVTIAPPAGLFERVECLLERIGWEGVFELELLESVDGRLHAIDLNPRVFGQMAIMIAAGANIPAIWCDHVLGRRTATDAQARPGVTYRWEDGELKHLAWQLRRRHVLAALAVLRPHRRVVHAHLRATDPGPFLARLIYLALQASARARNGATSRRSRWRSREGRRAGS